MTSWDWRALVLFLGGAQGSIGIGYRPGLGLSSNTPSPHSGFWLRSTGGSLTGTLVAGMRLPSWFEREAKGDCQRIHFEYKHAAWLVFACEFQLLSTVYAVRRSCQSLLELTQQWQIGRTVITQYGVQRMCRHR